MLKSREAEFVFTNEPIKEMLLWHFGRKYGILICHINYMELYPMSSESETVTIVAVFYSEVGAQEAYNDVLSAIKEGTKFVEITGDALD